MLSILVLRLIWTNNNPKWQIVIDRFKQILSGRYKKLICLVEKRNKRMKNKVEINFFKEKIGVNWFICPY